MFESRLCDEVVGSLSHVQREQCRLVSFDLVANSVTIELRVLDPITIRNEYEAVLCVVGVYVPPLEQEPSCLTEAPSKSPTISTTLTTTEQTTTQQMGAVERMSSDDDNSATVSLTSMIAIILAVVLLLMIVGAIIIVRERRSRNTSQMTISPVVQQGNPSTQKLSTDKEDLNVAIERLMANGMALPLHRATWLKDGAELSSPSSV